MTVSAFYAASFLHANFVPRVQATGGLGSNSGPGQAQILIHQYLTTDSEMQAFEQGKVDVDDWPVPDAYLAAWTGSDPARNVVTAGKVTLLNSADLGMFEVDINNGIPNPASPEYGGCSGTGYNNCNNPTSTKAVRQALSYLLDRQTIVLNYAGGRAIPICAATAPSQPGAKSCTALGYPTQYGDFNPAKAIQTLWDAGWRESPAGSGTLVLAPYSNTLIIVIRTDDPIRLQMGQQLAAAIQAMPSSFTCKSGEAGCTAGSTVTVCTAANCKLNVDSRLLDRSAAGRVVFRHPWFDWNLYTGGFSLGFEADFLAFEFGSTQAPLDCGGAWSGDFPNNYDCVVDATYDFDAAPLITYTDLTPSAGCDFQCVVNKAVARTVTYGWGYNSATGKVTGIIPDLSAYTTSDTKAAWKYDVGSAPIKTNPDGSPACWNGFTSQDTGFGLPNYYTITDLQLYNCKQTTTAGYASYRGQGQADWGFKSTIDELNIAESEFLWDFLAMGQTYESLLDRNPVNLPQLIPLMAESFAEGTYFNTALGRTATVTIFNLRPMTWSDGVAFTCQDAKFSLEYMQKNFSPIFFSSVEHVYDIQCPAVKPDGSQTLVVYFDDSGPLFTVNAGGVPMMPQHVWCADYNPAAGNDVGPGVPARANCKYPDMVLFDPDMFNGLGCSDCPAGTSPLVGLGPDIIASCTGPSCTETITLKTNPFYTDTSRFWSQASGTSLQPDVNRDGVVNQADLDLLTKLCPSPYTAAACNDPRFDVDFRITGKGTWSESVPIKGGSPVSISLTLLGTHVDATDYYIVKHFIFEATQTGQTGIPWPTGQRLTYVWPDINKDNLVNVNDLIAAWSNQFKDPTTNNSKLTMSDVNYDGKINLSDELIVFAREFTKPAGV